MAGFPDADARNAWRRRLDEKLEGWIGGLPAGGGGDAVRSTVGLLDMFNPVSGLEDAGSQSRVAFNPENSMKDRIFSGIGALANTAGAAAPLAIAKLLGKSMTTAAGRYTDDAVDVVSDVFRGVGHVPGRVDPAAGVETFSDVLVPPRLDDLDPRTPDLLMDEDLIEAGLPGMDANGNWNGFGNPWETVEPIARDNRPALGDNIDLYDDGQRGLYELDDVEERPFTDRGVMSPAPESLRDSGNFYSRAERAADNLKQPFYGSLEEVEKNLLKGGATQFELNRLGFGYLDEVLAHDGPGKIPREMVQAWIKDWRLPDIEARSLGRGTKSGLPTRFSDEYSPPGGWEHRETIVTDPGVVGNENIPGISSATSHWGAGSSDEGPIALFDRDLPRSGVPVAHIRSANYMVGGEDTVTHHLVEVQSDVAQAKRKIEGLGAQARALKDSDSAGTLLDAVANSPEILRNANPRIDDAVRTPAEWVDRVVSADPENLDDHRLLLNKYAERTMWNSRPIYDVAGDFRDFVDRAINDASPEKLADVNSTHAGNTTKWTELAVKKSLVDAIENPDPDVTYLSWSSGDMANTLTGQGETTRRGMQGFYDDVFPKRIKAVLRDLGKRSGLEMPEIQDVTMGDPKFEFDRPKPRSYTPSTVKGIPLTENLRRAIKEYGFPLFAVPAGLVAGSSLEQADVFGDREGL